MSAENVFANPLLMNRIAHHTTTRNMRRVATTSKAFGKAAIRSLNNSVRRLRLLREEAIQWHQKWEENANDLFDIELTMQQILDPFEEALGDDFHALWEYPGRAILFAKMILEFAAHPKGVYKMSTRKYIQLRDARRLGFPDGPNGIVNRILRHNTVDNWAERVKHQMSQISGPWLHYFQAFDIPYLLNAHEIDILASTNGNLQQEAQRLLNSQNSDFMQALVAEQTKQSDIGTALQDLEDKMQAIVDSAGNTRLPNVDWARPDLYHMLSHFAALGINHASLMALPAAHAKGRHNLLASYQ
jgi:hypothetical protein